MLLKITKSTNIMINGIQCCHQLNRLIVRQSCKKLQHFLSLLTTVLQPCNMYMQGIKTLLAFTAKYGVSTNQWTWLCQALLEVSVTTITLWICVCADDWTAELAVKASNEWQKKDNVAIAVGWACQDIISSERNKHLSKTANKQFNTYKCQSILP